VLQIHGRRPVELKSFANNHSAAPAVSPIHRLRARRRELVRYRESHIVQEPRIRCHKRRNQRRLQRAHLRVMGSESLAESLRRYCCAASQQGDRAQNQTKVLAHRVSPPWEHRHVCAVTLRTWLCPLLQPPDRLLEVVTPVGCSSGSRVRRQLPACRLAAPARTQSAPRPPPPSKRNAPKQPHAALPLQPQSILRSRTPAPRIRVACPLTRHTAAHSTRPQHRQAQKPVGRQQHDPRNQKIMKRRVR